MDGGAGHITSYHHIINYRRLVCQCMSHIVIVYHELGHRCYGLGHRCYGHDVVVFVYIISCAVSHCSSWILSRSLCHRKGWHQFAHRSATRGFEVAQDRVLELVELLNITCPPHLETLREQGIALHNQEVCEDGLIDLNRLHALARKRPSSRCII